ncbi:MAG: hypothetical protein J1F07_04175 [Muribaculaceae bacterium]|nr:hypothetical protein [Muribaculaceae bacterium]
MRQKISYDSSDYTGSVIFWILLICLAFCCIWWWTPDYNYTDTTYQTYDASSGWGSGWVWFWIIIGILFLWWIFALCFTPLDVYADDDEVRIRRPLKTKRIRMDEIASAEPYKVAAKPGKKAFKSMPIRTFGRWGQYHDDNIGDYFAYYGKPDNTVLITLKDGRKYVVGGSDAEALASYINERANKG